MKKTSKNLIKILSYMISSYKGPTNRVQTDMESRIYNFVSGGKYQNPYLGKLKLPSIPGLSLKCKNLGLEDVTVFNHRANKYLEYQERRLEKARSEGNDKLYFAIVRGLMKRSVSYRICFFHRTNKGWYFNQTLTKIYSTIIKFAKVHKETYMRTTRSYILKPNGKYRPIGSPRKEWNMYLSMLSWSLTHWTKDRLGNQHGFVPGRGLWSSWIDFLTKVRHSKNILEFDYSKCFNSIPLYRKINIPWINALTNKSKQLEKGFWEVFQWNNSQRSDISLQSALIKEKLPKELVNKILEMNETEPNTITEITNDDPELWHKRYENKDSHKFINNIFPLTNIKSYTDVTDMSTDREYIIINGVKYLNNEKFGLTQGAPTSPILCNIYLQYWESKTRFKDVEHLKYADDGFYYTDTPDFDWNKLIDYKEGNTLGIKFNRDKTKVIKENDKWLTEQVKFLGSIFNTKLETLNDIPLDKIDQKNLFKIVGKTYNTMLPEPWSWEIKPKSLLSTLFDSDSTLIDLLTVSKDTEDKTFAKANELSTIAIGLLLKSLHEQRKRKIHPKVKALLG